jgi:hypothetical protein
VNYFSTLAAIPLPGTVKSFASATQEHLPELRSNEPVKALENAAQARVPGMSDDLPPKLDPLGRPIPSTPEGRNKWVYHLLDPSKASTIPENDPLLRLIWQTYEETGDDQVIPGEPPRVQTLGGIKAELSDEQWQWFRAEVGRKRVAILGMARPLLENGQIKPEDVADALGRANQIGLQMGKEALVEKYPELFAGRGK